MSEYPHNFGGLPEEYTRPETSRVVILPVPFDGTSTWGKGADRGPDAIIEASANMELYDIETGSEVYRQGIFTADPVQGHDNPEELAAEVRTRVKGFLRQGKMVVCLGGEHSISIGAVQAYHECFPALSVLQIDAHTDLRDEYNGSRFNHACVMARVRELCNFVQVGIRSMDAGELKNINKEGLFLARDIRNDAGWQQKVVDQLEEMVYVTIDLDGFDPSILPSTGTPEPGGLLWYEVTDLLKLVASRKKIVGFDVVELAPNPAEKSSDFLAARLVYQTLSYIFSS